MFNELNLDYVEPVKNLIELDKYCEWLTLCKDFVVLQHRYQEVHRDSNDDLHNES